MALLPPYYLTTPSKNNLFRKIQFLANICLHENWAIKPFSQVWDEHILSSSWGARPKKLTSLLNNFTSWFSWWHLVFSKKFIFARSVLTWCFYHTHYLLKKTWHYLASDWVLQTHLFWLRKFYLSIITFAWNIFVPMWCHSLLKTIRGFLVCCVMWSK